MKWKQGWPLHWGTWDRRWTGIRPPWFLKVGHPFRLSVTALEKTSPYHNFQWGCNDSHHEWEPDEMNRNTSQILGWARRTFFFVVWWFCGASSSKYFNASCASSKEGLEGCSDWSGVRPFAALTVCSNDHKKSMMMHPCNITHTAANEMVDVKPGKFPKYHIIHAGYNFSWKTVPTSNGWRLKVHISKKPGAHQGRGSRVEGCSIHRSALKLKTNIVRSVPESRDRVDTVYVRLKILYRIWVQSSENYISYCR